MFCLNEEDEEDDPSQSDSGKDFIFKVFLKFLPSTVVSRKPVFRYGFNFRACGASAIDHVLCRLKLIIVVLGGVIFIGSYPSSFKSLSESNCRKHFLS